MDKIILGGGKIGDMFVKTSMFKALKEHAYHAKIDIVVDPSADTGIVRIALAYNIPIVGIYPKVPKTFECFKLKSDKYLVFFGANEGGISIDGYSKKDVLKNISTMVKELENIR